MPEKGKGIEDRWSRNVGTVLKTYYAKEELRKLLREAQSLESERDKWLAQFNDKQAAFDLARGFLKDNESLVMAAEARQGIEARLSEAERECSLLEKDLHAWLRAEVETTQARPDVERLEPLRKKLDEELREALERAKRKDRLNRFERARAARNLAAEVRAKMSLISAIRAEDVKRLRSALLEMDRLKGQVKGGKLQLQLHVKKDLEVSFRKDFESTRTGVMAAGKSMTLHAGGRIQLENDWFELQVTGGEGFEDMEEKLARAEEALANLFTELKVKTLEEAEENLSKIAALQLELRSAEAEFARALLPGEKWEELNSLALETSGRDPDVIRSELSLVQRELEGKRKALAGAEGVLQSLRDRAASSDSAALSTRLMERKTALSQLSAQRQSLPVLPLHLGSAEEFLARYRGYRDRLPALSEELGALRVEVAEVKAKLPEQSAQDLERGYLEANSAFDRELARARALLRVENAVLGLESTAVELYGDFRSELEKLVRRLSDNKYKKAAFADAMPSEFERKDGAIVPFEWLSAGTKDAFALALRLAMASYFLKGSDGFLLIDDPLVNMDPARQKVAASLIREFAAERQVVVFTCHPSHAELLGGNRIEL
jgi:exonuclease SbcC